MSSSYTHWDKTRFFIAFVLVLLTQVSICYAQPDMGVLKQELDTLITLHTHTIQSTEYALEGEGVHWMLEQASEAQFFMIGERHATAEIPHLSTQLLEQLIEQGYTAVALEVGPNETRYMADLIQKGGFEALEHFIDQPGNEKSGGFLNWREEALYATSAIEAVGSQNVWGLDQEGFFSLPMNLERLKTRLHTEEEKQAFALFASKATNSETFMGNGDLTAFNALRSTFALRGDQEALGLIDDLLFSRTIYGPYLGQEGSFYYSNVDRENYMKNQFLEQYTAFEEREGHAPKVVFKFGGFHSGTASISLNRVTLGTFLQEWGRAYNYDVFSVYMDCLSGERLTTGGSEHVPAPCAGIFDTSGQNAGGEGVDSPIKKHLKTDEITLINLIPLRDRLPEWQRSGILDETTANLIRSFDAYLSIPNTTAATPIAKLK